MSDKQKTKTQEYVTPSELLLFVADVFKAWQERSIFPVNEGLAFSNELNKLRFSDAQMSFLFVKVFAHKPDEPMTLNKAYASFLVWRAFNIIDHVRAQDYDVLQAGKEFAELFDCYEFKQAGSMAAEKLRSIALEFDLKFSKALAAQSVRDETPQAHIDNEAPVEEEGDDYDPDPC